ncbi:hypothetical protein D9M68_974810 [compost metagenome]
MAFINRLVADLRVASMRLPQSSVPCPKCKTGQLRLRKGEKGNFWGCSHWKAEPEPGQLSCDARYPDANGSPNFQATPKHKGFGFKRVG